MGASLLALFGVFTVARRIVTVMCSYILLDEQMASYSGPAWPMAFNALMTVAYLAVVYSRRPFVRFSAAFHCCPSEGRAFDLYNSLYEDTFILTDGKYSDETPVSYEDVCYARRCPTLLAESGRKPQIKK